MIHHLRIFPVEADDGEDIEIPCVEPEVEGAEILECQIAIRPSPEDEVNVNGTMLRENSGLAALRAGCSCFYGYPDEHVCFSGRFCHKKVVFVLPFLGSSP